MDGNQKLQREPAEDGMKLVIFGLSITSSWGNWHAIWWRGLVRALARRGHDVVFMERASEVHANHRDLDLEPPIDFELVWFPSWTEVVPTVRRHLREADAAIVSSRCPDAVPAGDELRASGVPLKVFYELSAPNTLARFEAGDDVPHLPPRGLRGFDLVLSTAGGPALEGLRSRLGATLVASLPVGVDPEVRRAPPGGAIERYRGDLGYLGAYAADRRDKLDRLLFDVAARAPNKSFVVGGALYPADRIWASNIRFIPEVPVEEVPAFLAGSALALNVTPPAAARIGHGASLRLLEAAAAGIPVLSDPWPGMKRFLTPGKEILVAETSDQVLEALALPATELLAIGRRAKERVLDEHTADKRAELLLDLLVGVAAEVEAQRCSA
jgi:spore maturation protein CgeB